MGGQCHTTLGNACYPKRAEALDVRIVCLHFLMQLVPRVHPCVCRGDITCHCAGQGSQDSHSLQIAPTAPGVARMRCTSRQRSPPCPGAFSAWRLLGRAVAAKAVKRAISKCRRAL